MIKEILKIILLVANPSLEEYHKHCSEIEPYVIAHYKFTPRFYNERSISSFMSNSIYISLNNSNLFNSVQYINEFAIKLDAPITTVKFNELKSKHGLKHIKTPNHFLQLFYPDTILQLQYDQKFSHVFVEYKVSSKFILAELAYDFLKYILYTDNSTANSIFIYIMLNKDSNNKVFLLSDSNGIPMSYQISHDDFNEKVKLIGAARSIFIYEKSKSACFQEQSYMELDVLREIDKVINTIKDENMNVNNVLEVENFQDNPLVYQIDKFGENVITSSIINERYFDILNIREIVSSNKDIHISLSEQCPISLEAFNCNLDKSDDEKSIFVEKVASYFSNQMKCILKNVKQNKSVFNYSYRRANWVLIVIAKFLSINNIEIPNFRIIDFCEDDEDTNEVELLLEKAYEKEQYKDNINSLGLSLIYYITEVYPVIYDISDDKIKIKETYQAYKSKKTFIDLIHDFNRIKTNKKKMTKTKWEDVDIENAISEIAVSVISKYLKN